MTGFKINTNYENEVEGLAKWFLANVLQLEQLTETTYVLNKETGEEFFFNDVIKN